MTTVPVNSGEDIQKAKGREENIPKSKGEKDGFGLVGIYRVGSGLERTFSEPTCACDDGRDALLCMIRKVCWW